jgi:hypothetical protein
MFKRKNKGMNPLTLDDLESLGSTLADYLKSLENKTLLRIQNTYDFMGKLSEKQVRVYRAVFWELYSREEANEKHEVVESRDFVQDVNHRTRSQKAREIGNQKLANVKAKRYHKREAANAKKCGHTGGMTKKISRIAASPKFESDDVVDLRDVREVVYHEMYEDGVYDLLVLMAELAENEPEQETNERPGPWDLDLCGPSYDTFPDCWGGFPYDSD